ANAVNATAQVKPSYDAHVTLVLDLSDPVLHDPPVVQTNPDGSTVLVDATPTGANRVLLRTSDSTLFTADFPVDASVDLFANAGFLQVELKGSAHVCQTDAPVDCSAGPPPGHHMVEVDLKDHGDITFGQLVTLLLNTPKDLLDFTVHVRGSGSVTASIPGASDFFPGGGPQAGFHWNDLTELDPNSTNGPHFDFAALSKLAKVDFDPSNPRALFSIILKTLQTVQTVVSKSDPTSTASQVFTKPIPLVGRSLSDLLKSDESGVGPQVSFGANTLKDASRSDVDGNAAPNAFPQALAGRTIVAGTQVGLIASVTNDTLTMASNWATQPSDGVAYMVRSELDDVISILEASPSDNMQKLVDLLNSRLGHVVPITFAYADDATVGNQPSLILKLDWKRSFHTSAPVQFDFNLPIGDQKLAGVQGSGSVSLGASGEVKLGLVIPLAPGDGPAGADALQVLDNSAVSMKLDASVDDGSLATTIGPLSIALGDPTQGSTDKATAKASYSVGLGKASPTGNAESFSDFFGEVGPTVNASSTAVDCGFTGGTVDLSLCARLPLYVSAGGGNWQKLITTAGVSNEFALRLPKAPQGAADQLDIIDLGGAAIDGHARLETPDPTELADAIKNHLIDLTRFDGIDSFLNMLQQSLVTASFGGKLPLVGNDLQQGADFVGKLKTTIDSAIGDLATVNSISGLRDWVNDKLAAGLQSAGLNPDLVKVDTQCKTTLGTVTPAPTVAVAVADASTETYTYSVASYIKDSSNQKHEATPSALGDVKTGPAFKADGVSPSKNVNITWTAVDHAAGYDIYRQDGGQLTLLADTGSAITFTDDGSVSPGAAPLNPAGPNPFLTDCDFSDFESVLIRLDVSQGDFAGDFLKCDNLPAGHDCLTQDVPLDIGIPGLSLRAKDPSQGPQAQLGWRLHLAFGISRSDGFFVDTKDGDPQPEFAVGLNLTLPGPIQAQLAFINVDASNCVQTDTANCTNAAPTPATAGDIPPLFGGTFKINITSPHADGRLTLSDLGSADLGKLFDVQLTAGVHIDWLLKATVDQGAGFPGIQAEFQLSWEWKNAHPGDNSDTGGNKGLQIAFQRVQIDAGAIFSQVLGPIIREIKKVTGPLEPIIKTLYAPIPVLSDLSHLVGGDDITLVSIAKAFSTVAGGPDLTFVDRVLKVVQLVNSLPTGANVLIPIGSFSLVGSTALSSSATPDNTNSLINPASKVLAGGANGADGVLGALDTNDGKGASSPKILSGTDAGGKSKTADAGFSFPVFKNPSSLFNLLLGGDVDLVKFDSGPLTLGFDWRQEFGPVYAPPPVLITLHGSASVTMHIVAGFDTYGIRKAFEAVRDGTFTAASVGDAILQSLFFYTTDDAGKPIPVVSFNGELAAGAEVSAVIITVGIEGGVGLTVSFLWNDPNHDGKFRLSEFVVAALNNPICLFTVSGRVYVFLKLFVKIGFGPFSVSFSFTIVDVTLLDFSVTPNCDPPPPKLGALGDGGKTLVVYAAALGDPGHRGDPAYDSSKQDKETVKITSLHDYDKPGNPFIGVAVEMIGTRNEFLNPNIERVVVDGRGYDKPMSVTFIGDGKQDVARTGIKPPTLSFEKDAIVFGGNKDDQIKTGIGNSWVDGGDGNDGIVTGDRTVLAKTGTGAATTYSYVNNTAKAIVAGGGGDDSITVGNGDDVISGDGTLNNGPGYSIV
ncbi:MAG: hypothetical protein QOG98_1612, partial [Pseudonocardiales bacterium]|nr:hypothetical protein [Pseudonocardiales bacterium]